MTFFTEHNHPISPKAYIEIIFENKQAADEWFDLHLQPQYKRHRPKAAQLAVDLVCIRPDKKYDQHDCDSKLTISQSFPRTEIEGPVETHPFSAKACPFPYKRNL